MKPIGRVPGSHLERELLAIRSPLDFVDAREPALPEHPPPLVGLAGPVPARGVATPSSCPAAPWNAGGAVDAGVFIEYKSAGIDGGGVPASASPGLVVNFIRGGPPALRVPHDHARALHLNPPGLGPHNRSPPLLGAVPVMHRRHGGRNRGPKTLLWRGSLNAAGRSYRRIPGYFPGKQALKTGSRRSVNVSAPGSPPSAKERGC